VGFKLTEKLPDWRAFTEEVYQIFLMRPADADALERKAAALEANLLTPSEIISELIMSDEFGERAPEFLHRYGVTEKRGLFNESSQFGELQLLLRRWINDSASARYVVDVGARGRERSNSYDLLRHFGWRGLLIEANPNLIDSIRREFGGLDIQIANCAISDHNGRARLTLGANDDVSSLELSSAESWGATRGSVAVTVRRLPDLLLEYDVPRRFDLLSIDIEGEDVKVLNDLAEDGRFSPDWVLIEASHDFATQSLADLPTSETVKRNFEIVGRTRANLLLKTVRSA
jgi:FkbM family methyltransferase